jgi:phosphoenolpyruvate carboxylase
VLPANYSGLNDDEKIDILTSNEQYVPEKDYKNPIINDTIASIKAVKLIQEYNGELGCNRYIISHCSSALNILEVYGLFILSGWKKAEMNIDIVPLFETINDLRNAASILNTLYAHGDYRKHLKRRNNKQIIML